MKMQNHVTFTTAALIVSLVALPACKRETGEVVAELRNPAGATVGEATLEAVEDGVRIRLEGSDLPPGSHGFHIHENGECTPPTFESAGGHFNPTNASHGLEDPAGPHLGDLPNIEVGVNGTVTVDVIARGVTLAETGETSLVAGNGTALVVHAQPDDNVSDPSGNAGDRIACGVITQR